jgi:hypothetical protein
MRTWIAAASIAVTLAAPSLRADPQCDPRSLICAAPAASESFVDLMSEGARAAETPLAASAPDRAAEMAADAPQAISRPAVYMGGRTAALPAATASGAAMLNSAVNGFSGNDAMPGWLALPTLAAQPAPSFAWVLALGFLGLIVLRRTRASRGD